VVIIKLEHAYYISQLVVAITIVLSLLFVSVQIDQNTTAIKGSAVSSAASVSLMELMPLVDSDFGAVFRKSLDSPESLTLDEIARLSARNVMMLVGRENEFEQLQLGTLDKWGWKRSEAAVKYALNNRWHKHWWETVGRHIFRPDFVEWIDGVLKDSTIIMDKGYFENLRLK